MATKGDFVAARKQLIRAAKCNGRKISSEFEKKLSSLEHSIQLQRLAARRQQSYSSTMDRATMNSVRCASSNHSDQQRYYIYDKTTCIVSDKYAVAQQSYNNDGYHHDDCAVSGSKINSDQHQIICRNDCDDIDNNNGTDNKARSYRLLITNRILLRDTLILAYIQFLGHMFYYYLTINFAYMKNLSMEANFITSGIGEWVACGLGAILLRLFSRRSCMSSVMIVIGLTFVFQSIIDSGAFAQLNNYIVVTTNNAIGTLASLLLIFVTMIVNQEVYPTVIRQSGTSIVLTVGEFGSTLSPFMIHLCASLGHWTSHLPFAAVCLLGSVLIRFVSKTDDKELADT